MLSSNNIKRQYQRYLMEEGSGGNPIYVIENDAGKQFPTRRGLRTASVSKPHYDSLESTPQDESSVRRGHNQLQMQEKSDEGRPYLYSEKLAMRQAATRQH